MSTSFLCRDLVHFPQWPRVFNKSHNELHEYFRIILIFVKTYKNYSSCRSLTSPYLCDVISHKFIDSPSKGPQGAYAYTIWAFITIVLLNNLINKKNCWDVLIWVTGHCNRAAVSRNRYGVEQTVDNS